MQAATNTRVTAKAIEEGESLLSLHERHLIHVRSTIAQLDNRLGSTLQAMQNAAAEYRWSLPCNWAFDTLISRYGFILSPAELATHDKVCGFDPSGPIFSLNELVETDVSKSRMRHHRETLHPLNTQARQPVSDHVISLYDFLHADVLSHAKDELSRTDVGISRCVKQIKNEKALRDEAMLESKPQVAEKHHRALVDAYVELLEILNSRVSQLLLTNNDTSNFRGQAKSALNDANECFSKFLSQSKELLESVLKDITRSDEVGEDEHHRDAASLRDFSIFERETIDGLLKNGERQKEIFRQIQELGLEMKSLSEERLQMLEHFNTRKSTEEKRVANYDEFKIVHTEHLRYLNRLRELAENRVAAAEQLSSFHDTMQRKLEEKNVEGELEALTLEESKSYLEHYRGFIFEIGDLMTRKDLRVETLLRQQRHVQLQREVALDSLDPEADQYTSRFEGVAKSIDECQADIAQQRVTQNICTENFKEVETVLLKFSVPFEHPLIEYSEKSAKDREKYVTKAQFFVETEESEVEHSRERMKKLQNLAEHERQALREKAAEFAAAAVQKAKSPKPPPKSSGDKEAHAEEK